MAEGAEKNKQVPDFLAVKANLGTGNPRDHSILSIFEIKLAIKVHREVPRQWHEQMMSYMMAARDHPNRDEDLVGFLVCGRLVRKYHINGGLNGSVAYSDDFDLFDDPANTLTMTLCRLVSLNWNEAR